MSSFLADCPICNEQVTAFLVSGSLENLQKGEGDVELAHLTNDPKVGDHKWLLTNPQVRANLLKFVQKENWDRLPDNRDSRRGTRPR